MEVSRLRSGRLIEKKPTQQLRGTDDDAQVGHSDDYCGKKSSLLCSAEDDAFLTLVVHGYFDAEGQYKLSTKCFPEYPHLECGGSVTGYGAMSHLFAPRVSNFVVFSYCGDGTDAGAVLTILDDYCALVHSGGDSLATVRIDGSGGDGRFEVLAM